MTIDKFKIEFENRLGDKVELYNNPYELVSFLGLGDVSADIQTFRTPFLDGSTYLDAILQPRYIDVRVKIKATSNKDMEEKRNYLSRVLNPKQGPGTLRYISDTQVREITAIATSLPIFPDGLNERHRVFQYSTIQFVCPNPYWRSGNETTVQLASFIPLFQFPFEGEFQMGIEGSEVLINNRGGFPLPIKVTLRGPSTNPIIRNNTTGEFIRVRRDLLEDDIMVIDTEQKTVLLNGENAFPYIDLSSTFFYLALGPNVITYEADSGTEDARLEISYRELFGSI